MGILNVVRKRGQRINDYKADFEQAVRAAYPEGADVQTTEFLTQIFVKGLLPKYHRVAIKKDDLKSVDEVADLMKRKEMQEVTEKANVASVKEDVK